MPYETESQWNQEEVRKLSRERLWKMSQGYWLMVAVMVVILSISWYLLLHYKLVKVIEMAVVMSILLVVLVAIATEVKAIIGYRTNRTVQCDIVKYRFYDDHVELESNSSRSVLTYDRFYRITESAENFYLWISKNQAFLIIKKDCPEGLIEFLRGKM